MDKSEMAKEIGQLEASLSTSEAAIRKTEEKVSSAGRNRTAGAGALLIGIVGFLFISNWWGLWVFLGIIGVLTLLTAISGQGAAKRLRDAKQAELTQTRARLAELRALLIAG